MQGAFGKVFQVRKRDTGEIFAMKVRARPAPCPPSSPRGPSMRAPPVPPPRGATGCPRHAAAVNPPHHHAAAAFPSPLLLLSVRS